MAASVCRGGGGLGRLVGFIWGLQGEFGGVVSMRVGRSSRGDELLSK